jgi:hypothetical protein
MNNERVRKAIQALHTTRAEYQTAAKEFLTAIEATPTEIQTANQIIHDDSERTGGDLPHDLLSHDEHLASTILEEVRIRQSESKCPITQEELQAAIDSLVEEGKLVMTGELRPGSDGQLLPVYVAAEYAIKPNPKPVPRSDSDLSN